MARRREDDGGFNPQGWMFTFSDLVTLLLTFFVMLLAVRQPEIQKLKEAFGIFAEGGDSALEAPARGEIPQIMRLLGAVTPPASRDLRSPNQDLARDLDLPGSAEPGLAGSLQEGMSMRSDPRGAVVTLANDLMFTQGSSQLTPQAEAALHRVAELMRPGDMPISVEGHTDDVPVPPGKGFQDNWGLSLARALAVAHRLTQVEGIRASRLRVAALGPSRPLASNDTPAHRALNRRIEIVLLVDGG